MTRNTFRALGPRCFGAVLAMAVTVPAAQAAGDLTKQDPIIMVVQLGDDHDALRFVPDLLTFETGKLYKLEIHNGSNQKHYFSSDQFSGAVFTRKVQINAQDGAPIAEVKGTVREIEVYPGHKAEWWFVPVKAGTFDDLRCTIPGHAESGMVGRIIVK